MRISADVRAYAEEHNLVTAEDIERRLEQEMATKSAEFAEAGNRVYLPIDAASGAPGRS